jgi:hypothetical protein
MPSNANLSGLTERRSTSINLLSTSRSNIPASVVTGSAAMPGTRRSSLSTRRRGAVRREGVPEPHTIGLRRALEPRSRRVLRAQPSDRLPYIRGSPRASLFKMMDVSRQRLVDTPRGYVRDAGAFREQRLRRVRWGAPAESNEASTCKHYAPAAQREKVSKFAPGSTSGAGRHAAQLKASAGSGGLRFVRFAW